MKKNFCMIIAALIFLFCLSADVSAQKFGYINSQQILAQYKEAQDAQEQLDKINKEWEAEGRELQAQFQELGQQLESQSLLLSEERQQEKQAELQALYQKIQQFQNEKWGQNGEFFRKQEEIMKPIYDKINAAIQKVGQEERYDYVFDTVAGNIVYVSDTSNDLTEFVIEELEKGLESTKSPSGR
ncbi:OmpH family outer membrane protein [candidate division KSB1 bacterium]|nr:OmpH family outer membrane protein [candidate division KSB1 bacterium]RQW07534.1 MAG: OmpH family outer membrane protein [candidate division KSB1 bacterium]